MFSRGTDVQAEVNALKDIGKRLPLGHDSLPSICCYTFHNTYSRYVENRQRNGTDWVEMKRLKQVVLTFSIIIIIVV
jgi:hypothetical protein